ncbi:MAG: DUF2779 domain-containing protein [Proteobacteria bacterium]|nr:DUF2779 domain-containing protein [Pseudomonadota bacterium]
MGSTISKSKYMNGLQCSRLLWFVVNSPEELPTIEEDKQFIFDQGHEVGDYAKKLFPKGVEVPYDSNFIELTRKFVSQRDTIFEGAFSCKGTFAKIDILKPVNKDEWDIIEVKSSTKVKDENIDDVAFQRFVVEGAGLKVRRCHQIYVNNEYVRDGDIDPKEFLSKEDVTDRVAEKLDLEDNIIRMQKVIALKKPPTMSIGPHCSNPYDCPLSEKCWSFLPEHNVTELYYFGQKKYEMLNKDILSIKDLPSGVKLSDKQRIQIAAIKSGKPLIDKESIKRFLKSLEYPVYCLDFETLGVAVPPFDKARPYQKIPFQFSVHVTQKMNSDVESHSFLADGRKNFAPELIKALKVISPTGTVLAYNMSFEKQVLKVLAELSPKDANWLDSISDRLKDLIEPFRAFSYYHPDQHGSMSLKAVLPVLTDKSYKEMEIGEGGTASLKYYLTHFRDSAKEEKEKVRNALLEYCKLDTEGMVAILRKLEEISKQ